MARGQRRRNRPGHRAGRNGDECRRDSKSSRCVMKGETLTDALRWLASTAAINSIGRELSESTRRISELVASVKGYTHMGQAVVRRAGERRSRAERHVPASWRASSATRTSSCGSTSPPDLPQARGFGSELNQIWMNLIENALDAVDYGGEITIRAQPEFDTLIVSVIDNGHGIPDDIKDRIFDPFFTTKARGRRDRDGARHRQAARLQPEGRDRGRVRSPGERSSGSPSQWPRRRPRLPARHR